MKSEECIQAFQVGPVVLLWCSEHGPVGACEGMPCAMMAINLHIREEHREEEQ